MSNDSLVQFCKTSVRGYDFHDVRNVPKDQFCVP